MRNNDNNIIKRAVFAVVIILILIYGFRFYKASEKSEVTKVPAGVANVEKPETPAAGSAHAHLTATGEVDLPGATGEAVIGGKADKPVKLAAVSDKPRVVKPVEIAGKKGVITGSGVNVRSESRIDPTNANVVTKAGKGEKVEILGAQKPSNDNRQWYNIKLKNGKTGFVREDLIKID